MIPKSADDNHLTICCLVINRSGGPDRDQTDDLLIANEALYQLSYGPVEGRTFGDWGPPSTAKGVGGPAPVRPSVADKTLIDRWMCPDWSGIVRREAMRA